MGSHGSGSRDKQVWGMDPSKSEVQVQVRQDAGKARHRYKLGKSSGKSLGKDQATGSGWTMFRWDLGRG